MNLEPNKRSGEALFLFRGKSLPKVKAEEGLLRKHYLKDGKYLDAKLFALMKEDYEHPHLPTQSF